MYEVCCHAYIINSNVAVNYTNVTDLAICNIAESDLSKDLFFVCRKE